MKGLLSRQRLFHAPPSYCSSKGRSGIGLKFAFSYQKKPPVIKYIRISVLSLSLSLSVSLSLSLSLFLSKNVIN